MKRILPKIELPEGHDGKSYWRGIEEKLDTPEFEEWAAREFPEGVEDLKDPMSRRKFLTLMGASMALAGLSACRRPVEKIVPYVKAPEDIIPGLSQYYATTMPFGLNAYGVLVKSHEGRPTKIEGNEKHPSSLGKTNAFAQAEILNLYDPDRAKKITLNGADSTWQAFVDFWRSESSRLKSQNGKGLAILTESFASPTLARLTNDFLAAYPEAKVVVYEPVSDENIFEGIRIATGVAMQPIYAYQNAKVVLALDADIFQRESEHIVNSRGFIDGRRITSEKDTMNRLYAVESAFSLTGAMADHRLRLQSRQIGAFVAALALELKAQGLSLPLDLSAYASHNFDKKWIAAVAKDLLANKGASVLVAGRQQPALVHALVHALNDALGNLDKTVSYCRFKDAVTPSREKFAAFVKDMQAGGIETLVMLGVNPIYNAPADLNFADALKKVTHTIHFGSHNDETAKASEWQLPKAHFLESWGDARSADGTASLIQPLIAPLYADARSTVEVLNLITTGVEVKGYDLVRETWKKEATGPFEDFWRKALHDGVIENSASQKSYARIEWAKTVDAVLARLMERKGKDEKPADLAERAKNTYLGGNAVSKLLSEKPFATTAADSKNLEVVFHPSPSTYDGRYANNAWLQELPDPIAKVTWDNAALMSQETAKSLGLKATFALSEHEREKVKLRFKGKEIESPVWVVPGFADNSVTLLLGYGRTAVGRVGNGVGCNTYALRTTDAADFGTGVEIVKTNAETLVASTQYFGTMEGRAIVVEGTLAEYKKEPEFVDKKIPHFKPTNLYESPVKLDSGHQWGMVIDLNACIGCNACAIACQSENNIPVVGKEQTARGRHMHWIRIDRYFAGNDMNNPEMVYQPVACQHCENAPCEQVCPVAATVHDNEGLNSMIYNRCIGTRYCANNCPYKVRRFNYFNFQNDNMVWGGEVPLTVQMAMNPEVTVRSRGVMEKCTYCVQRIHTSQILAKNEKRELVDGEILSACQQVCPTDAIVFGNILDPNSKVAQLKKQNRKYELLAELNVKPRTSYLAKLRNPNPELETAHHDSNHKA